MADLTLHCGMGAPPPLCPFSQGQLVRGEHDSSWTCYSGHKVVTLRSSQDSWGGGKGLVSCPYPGSLNPVGTEGGGNQKVRVLGCLGRTLGSGLACGGQGVFPKPGDTLSGPHTSPFPIPWAAGYQAALAVLCYVDRH